MYSICIKKQICKFFNVKVLMKAKVLFDVDDYRIYILLVLCAVWLIVWISERFECKKFFLFVFRMVIREIFGIFSFFLSRLIFIRISNLLWRRRCILWSRLNSIIMVLQCGLKMFYVWLGWCRIWLVIY